MSLQVRVNTGDYQGTEALTSMTAELDELDDASEETERLRVRVEEAMLLQLTAIYRARGKSTSPASIAKLHGVSPPGGGAR